MEFIKTRAPYTYSDVYLTTIDGVTYRVAPKRPDNIDSAALCLFNSGHGWYPSRDLTEEELAEYKAFRAANK